MAAIDFREYHSDYKKLIKIKPLIETYNGKTRLNQNVVDVFLSYIKAIGKKLSAIQIIPNIDDDIKARVIAMRLTLLLEETICLNSYLKINRINNLQRAMAQFDLYKYKSETLYVYFKAYSYIAFVSGGILEHYDVAIDALQKAEEIFEFFKHKRRDSKQSNIDIYEPWELFSKKHIMRPMEDALNQMSMSYITNLTLLNIIYERLDDTLGRLKTMHLILAQEQYFVRLNQLEWLMKLLETIPITIDTCQFKRARYYLEVSEQILNGNVVENDVAKCQNIQCEIAKLWLSFTLAMFQYSRNKIKIKGISIEHNQPDKLALPNLNETEMNEDYEIQGSFQFETIKLDDFQFEFESICIKNHSEALNIANKCMIKAKYLLEICDSLAHPIDYISYNYQLADLYAHLAFFSISIEDEFNYLKCRIDTFVQMLTMMKSICPRVITVLQKDILIDLNEFQIDLLECNLRRISNKKTNVAGDFESENSKWNDKENLIKLLNEIRVLNKAMVK